MLDDLLNSTALTVVVAIAAAAAIFTPSLPADTSSMSVQTSSVEAPAPDLVMVYGADAAVLPMTVASEPVVQMPAVVVIGHREQPVEPTTVAAVESDAE